jgi:peptide-methionine (S)-S-oxide reductase
MAESPQGKTSQSLEAAAHFVLGVPIGPPYPEGTDIAEFAMGCFWGAERRFWSLEGVYVTAVGYEGGFVANPSYEVVCGGGTGHAETVRVVFWPKRISYESLLQVFWEGHDPTQGMRQGADIGPQYRSVIFVRGPDQKEAALASFERYQERLHAAGYGRITTEIVPAGDFYFAEPYHQQYLAKNPFGYCGLGGTGVSYC